MAAAALPWPGLSRAGAWRYGWVPWRGGGSLEPTPGAGQIGHKAALGSPGDSWTCCQPALRQQGAPSSGDQAEGGAAGFLEHTAQPLAAVTVERPQEAPQQPSGCWLPAGSLALPPLPPALCATRDQSLHLQLTLVLCAESREGYWVLRCARAAAVHRRAPAMLRTCNWACLPAQLRTQAHLCRRRLTAARPAQVSGGTRPTRCADAAGGAATTSRRRCAPPAATPPPASASVRPRPVAQRLCGGHVHCRAGPRTGRAWCACLPCQTRTDALCARPGWLCQSMPSCTRALAAGQGGSHFWLVLHDKCMEPG